MSKVLNLALASLILLTGMACSSGGGGGGNAGPQAANVTVNPVDSSVMNPDTPLVFTFSKSMNTASLTGNGTLWSESIGPVWTTVSLTDDTLTMAPPAGGWTEGAADLTMNVADLDGVTIPLLSLNYTVGCTGGLVNCNGSCADLSADTSNCGSCGQICGGAQTCNSGVCTGGACGPGEVDCSGTCSNLATDINNCGVCGQACNFPNALSVCTSGTCDIGSCNPGFSNCDLNIGTGCETDVNSDTNNCGGCGNVCLPGELCINSTCSASGCNTNTDCAGGTPLCNTSTNQCVECLIDADCPVSTPLCITGVCSPP